VLQTKSSLCQLSSKGLEDNWHSVTGTVTDAHGVDANSVRATTHSHTDSDNRSQQLSQSVTVPNGYPVTHCDHLSSTETAS